MNLVFNPDVFALGLAAGVLGLVLVLSLIVSFAYDEHTLLLLAGYLLIMTGLVCAGEILPARRELMQMLLLIGGPAWTTILVMWLLRNRSPSRMDRVVMAISGFVTLGLMAYYIAADAGLLPSANGSMLAIRLCLGWSAVLVAASFFLALESWESAGPWKLWLLAGHTAGLVAAMVFLVGGADTARGFWPVVLMLLLQVPPIYLCLVWRSRLINEVHLRSTAASVADPLTGLATTSVLIERLMRIVSRASNQSRPTNTSSALFLIHVQNWHGLLSELGSEFNEKLLLEAALRLRRSIGDNDLVARISGGRFAVIAQGLKDQGEVAALATRLVVSGLRIDSPLLPGVELQFRVIVRPLDFARPLTLAAAEAWLVKLAARFAAWPPTHRSRSILIAEVDEAQTDAVLHAPASSTA